MAKQSKASKFTSSVSYHAKRFWNLLKELGLTGLTGGSIVTAAIVAFGWVRDQIPWSALILMGLAGFSLFSVAYYHFVLAHRVSRFDPKKYRELGYNLVVFSRDAFRTMSDWDQSHPQMILEDGQPLKPRAQWEAERLREADRASVFVERHMVQAVAYLATLRGLGIYPPFHVSSSAMSRPHGFVVYLGAVGALLEQGHVEEARSMGELPEDGERTSFTFGLLS